MLKEPHDYFLYSEIPKPDHISVVGVTMPTKT